MEDDEWSQYTTQLYPLLETYLALHSNRDITRYLQLSYSFYSFHTENMASKSTKNQSFHREVSLFIIFFHDNLRSLITCSSAMHLAPAAMVLRAIFESRCLMKYLFLDAERRFDLFYRYKEVERYNASVNGYGPKMSPEFLQVIKDKNPEWFRTIDGKTEVIQNWAADYDITLSKMAKDTKLKLEYYKTYNYSSKFVHCSPLLQNVYQDERGAHPMPNSEMLGGLLMMATNHGIQALKEIHDFFGIQIPDKDFETLSRNYPKIETD